LEYFKNHTSYFEKTSDVDAKAGTSASGANEARPQRPKHIQKVCRFLKPLASPFIVVELLEFTRI